jgi:hypothetical protein
MAPALVNEVAIRRLKFRSSSSAITNCWDCTLRCRGGVAVGL